MEEFKDACDLLGQHANTPMSQEQVEELAKSIDINKDGFIDFNEFLEAFRLVDKRPPSPPADAKESGATPCNGVPNAAPVAVIDEDVDEDEEEQQESYCTKL
ncbi:hypothetical protein HPB48_004913 [Haemaphysalis longicornis]|uniref:EF-hand domain-containing protein n=1 Tax=Haemaphysalis longicornis TaxID=44386 RepID=A0A9J6GFA3_HAELO|nr:hypothetical protein HPB48_004913 [Haemaphysalis longicornis]